MHTVLTPLHAGSQRIRRASTGIASWSHKALDGAEKAPHKTNRRLKGLSLGVEGNALMLGCPVAWPLRSIWS
jgi:hypothetical protein